MSTLIQILVWIMVGLLVLSWLYVAARVVTRGVLRTLFENKRGTQHGKEETTQAGQQGQDPRKR